MGGANIKGCYYDKMCYGPYWKEGANDIGRKTFCCMAQQIRKIDETNAGYKARVTADKAVTLSDSSSGPITTNEVGFMRLDCVTGKWNDPTDGYVKYFKNALLNNELDTQGFTHPDVIAKTTAGSSPGLMESKPDQGGVTWAIYCNGGSYVKSGVLGIISAYFTIF